MFRRRRPIDGRSRAAQAGFSLIEICVTVAIMGIALALLVGSMATAESTSDLVAIRAQTESYARKAAELMRAQQPQCANNMQTTYETAIQSALGNSDDFDRTLEDVRFTQTTVGDDPTQWAHSGCVGSAQRVWLKIKVTSKTHSAVSVTVAALQRNTSPS